MNLLFSHLYLKRTPEPQKHLFTPVSLIIMASAAPPQKTDYLDVDPVQTDLKFALLSVVSPHEDSKQKSDRYAIKIRGAFATRQEAEEHCARLMKVSGMYDTWIVDLYKWLIIPPPRDQVETVYQEEYLNQLIKQYNESQVEARRHFEERKLMVMEEGLDKHLTEEERISQTPEQMASSSKDDALPVITELTASN